MNTLQKKRVKSVLKYTWPFYIIIGVVVGLVLSIIFGIVHKTPAYKTLTLFVSGETTDLKKLEGDLLAKYQENELKTVSCISAKPDDNNYNSKLTIAGYNGSDILIIPLSKLESLALEAFALEMSNQLINDYYQGYTFFKQEEINYGVKIDKEKIKDYMILPDEDCYLLLNGGSENIGEYSASQIKEHNTALKVVKDWGM